MMELLTQADLTKLGKEIAGRLKDTRNRELELLADLNGEQMLGPALRIVEPPIWELGHVGWFQDRWILQRLDGAEPAAPWADGLYDSFNIHNQERWELSYPSRSQTLDYIAGILERVIARLDSRDLTAEELYFYYLVLNHEDMHTETMHHIRHTLAYAAPRLSAPRISPHHLAIDPQYELHDVEIPGGTYRLGAMPDCQPFVFDNEKWAHPVEIEPFRISTTPVTFAQYRTFVDAGSYQERSLWSDAGWEWLRQNDQKAPCYWRGDSSGEWQWRWFDCWQALDPFLPMVHVNWYEADAYCRWAGRRLPTEVEWELAASGTPSPDGRGFTGEKRGYPWGSQRPETGLANLDSSSGGLVDVRALPAGDSAFGLRQMVGNVWEWTASTFSAYPGFALDPYAEYSAPSFGQQKVLRGGCWATRPHVIRNTFRNFYTPDRNNIFAGFRTVAL